MIYMQERLPTAAANDGSVGTIAWSNIDDALADDSVYASASTIPQAWSNYLKLTDYQFNIPSNASVVGIELVMKRRSVNFAVDEAVKLITSSGSLTTADKARAALWSNDPAAALYGGATDVWGTTWGADDINSSAFGVALSAELGSAATMSYAEIDTIAIRVYYSVTTYSQTIPKKYIAKVSRAGTYLGILQNVSNDFKLSEEINSAFSTMELEVADTFDIQREEPLYLTTEDGTIITTEAGDYITTERAYEIMGNQNPQALIRNHNDIEVYEVSTNYPSGRLIFNGWIGRHRARGGSETKITLYCRSHGTELDNYLIKSGDTSVASQTNNDIDLDGTFWGYALCQVVSPTSAISLDKVKFKLGIDSGFTALPFAVDLVQGTPTLDLVDVTSGITTYILGGSNTVLATSSTANVTESTATVKTFTFAETQALTPGTNYYLRFFFTQGQATRLNFGGSTASPTSPIGRVYIAALPTNNMTTAPTLSGTTLALYVDLISSSGNTVSPYSTQDPTNILRDVLDNYAGQGGQISYTSDTTELTGVTRSYTFRQNTTLEGIRKALELAPSDFYWYVDPATGLVYFKPTSTVADHVFSFGKELGDIELEIDAESNKNHVLFTGGDTGGGTNLYLEIIDEDAIEDNAGRVGLARITDSNVDDSPTGTVLAENYIEANKDEKNATVIQVLDKKYDTWLIRPGHTIGFQGYGNFINSFIIRVARIERHGDYAILTIGSLPPRTAAVVEEAMRRLNAIETMDNPSAPS